MKIYRLLPYILASQSQVAARIDLLIDPLTVPPVISDRFSELLSPFNESTVTDVSLSIGETALASTLFTAADRARLKQLGSEGYLIRSRKDNIGGSERWTVGVIGNPWALALARPSSAISKISLGTVFGAYRILQRLGFIFLHPLTPSSPSSLTNVDETFPPGVVEAESPQWTIRGFTHHTLHPLELMRWLNGIGSDNSYEDEAAFQKGLPLVQHWAEWLVARRQNRAQWVLMRLGKNFTRSALRHRRLQEVVRLFQQFGLSVGVDVPIVFTQENSFTLIDPSDKHTPPDEQMSNSIDWLMGCGFDFLASESGFSEFTHGSDEDMLAYMNFAGEHLRVQHQTELFMKCHISTDQACKKFKDPRTGLPLNFNFLPMLANNSVAIYPHTVQIPSFVDPSGHTYGTENSSFMLDWMMWVSAHQRNRSVVYKPENAYWGNYDIAVPLLLPVYPLKRIQDLHLIRQREVADKTQIQGQVMFTSGWEWGYWLSDVVAAEAVWNPRWNPGESSDVGGEAAAMELILNDVFANLLPRSAREDTSRWLVRAAQAQNETLIYGQRNTTGSAASGTPVSTLMDNGQAYIEGWDAINDLERLSSDVFGEWVPSTQPKRFGFGQVHFMGKRRYETTLRPLLRTMEDRFSELRSDLLSISTEWPAEHSELLDELQDAWQMTAIRAQFERLLFDYTVQRDDQTSLQAARALIDTAAAIVSQREKLYRAPHLTDWGPNPTSYHFGYLWTVHSQYYFWRDYYLAQGQAPNVGSPCFLNIQDPVDSQFGRGILTNLTGKVFKWMEQHRLQGLADCLRHPEKEPAFPLQFSEPNFV